MSSENIQTLRSNTTIHLGGSKQPEPSVLQVRRSSSFSQICPAGVNNRTFPGAEASVFPLLMRKMCTEMDKSRFLQVPPELPVSVMDSE